MRWLLFVVTLPWTLTVGWGWVLLMTAIRAAGSLRLESGWVLTATWKPWAQRRWKYSTTLGTGIVYQPEARAGKGDDWTPIQEHEHVHVRQVEDMMLLSLLVGISVLLAVGLGTGSWAFAAVLGAALWWSGGLWQAPNFLTAGLRNGWDLPGVYRGSEHELSAYSQTNRWCDGKSWLRDEWPRLLKWHRSQKP
jgi:hypothetical protein